MRYLFAFSTLFALSLCIQSIGLAAETSMITSTAPANVKNLVMNQAQLQIEAACSEKENFDTFFQNSDLIKLRVSFLKLSEAQGFEMKLQNFATFDMNGNIFLGPIQGSVTSNHAPSSGPIVMGAIDRSLLAQFIQDVKLGCLRAEARQAVVPKSFAIRMNSAIKVSSEKPLRSCQSSIGFLDHTNYTTQGAISETKKYSFTNSEQKVEFNDILASGADCFSLKSTALSGVNFTLNSFDQAVGFMARTIFAIPKAAILSLSKPRHSGVYVDHGTSDSNDHSGILIDHGSDDNASHSGVYTDHD